MYQLNCRRFFIIPCNFLRGQVEYKKRGFYSKPRKNPVKNRRAKLAKYKKISDANQR